MDLRTRRQIDWKLLCFGESLPREVKTKKNKVLPTEYLVERLVCKKVTPSKDIQYLVKWERYHKEESTWEPEVNLPVDVINSYFPNEISQDRLVTAALNFESSVQTRLKSRNNKTVIDFDLDIYRYCFESDKECVGHRDDFKKLPLSDHWFYNINKAGRGVQLNFPVRLQPKLFMKKAFVEKNGLVQLVHVPIERLVVTSAVDGLVIA